MLGGGGGEGGEEGNLSAVMNSRTDEGGRADRGERGSGNG